MAIARTGEVYLKAWYQWLYSLIKDGSDTRIALT